MLKSCRSLTPRIRAACATVSSPRLTRPTASNRFHSWLLIFSMTSGKPPEVSAEQLVGSYRGATTDASPHSRCLGWRERRCYTRADPMSQATAEATRILIVDDDASVRDVISVLLREEGYACL